MVAKRHHYIPQFLLKGFASRITKKAHLVYRFARGAEPHEVNIINVGVARNFHDGLSSDLEHRLAFRESKYATALEHLRRETVAYDDVLLVAEFIFNLMLRTKHIRDGITILGNEVLGLFELPATQRVLRDHAIRNAVAKRPEIANWLSRYPKNRRQRILLTQIAKRGVDLDVECKKLWAIYKSCINIGEIVKRAHLNELEKEGLPEQRKSEMQNFHWYIDRRPLGSFVLGDVGPLARLSETGTLTFPYGFGRPISVCLPISSTELLIGTSQPSREKLPVEEVNYATVELSRDFFVASKNTARESDYLRHLGTRATLMGASDIQRLFNEALDEFKNLRGRESF